MLNFDVNVNIDVKEVMYPILFEGINRCVHCGGNGTLSIVDMFGKKVKQEVHPYNHIVCDKCGSKYSIRWDRKSNGEFVPTAVNPSVALAFKNLVNPMLKNSVTNGVYN